MNKVNKGGFLFYDTEIKQEPGVYYIKNLSSGLLYIGSSSQCRKRLLSHYNQLRNNKHCNQHLQSSFNKHGESYFEIGVLEYCSVESKISREQHYIDHNKGNLFNILESAITCGRGGKLPTQVIEKIRLSNTGKKYPNRIKRPETIARIERERVVKTTRYIAKALEIAFYVDIHSPKPKTTFYPNRSYIMSNITKDKIGKSNKGNKPWNTGKYGTESPRYGIKASEDTKDKMSKAHKGHSRNGWKLSEETRQKMSKSQQNRRAKEGSQQNI